MNVKTDEKQKESAYEIEAGDTARKLIDKYGSTFAEEAGIQLRNTPKPLFQLLCLSLLLSAGIKHRPAMRVLQTLISGGWISPGKIAAAPRNLLARAINKSGYGGDSVKISGILINSARRLIVRYNGDLRRLREEAGRTPGCERNFLMQFKGLGKTGADIFFREIQGLWEENYPFSGRDALEAASKTGLPYTDEKLSQIVSKKDFSSLAAALIRLRLSGEYELFLRESGRI